MEKMDLGQCFNCGRQLRVKAGGVRPGSHVTCRCGERYAIHLEGEGRERLQEDAAFAEEEGKWSVRLESLSGLQDEGGRRRYPQYEYYLERVGDATCIDMTRRTDPACSDQPWERLEGIFEAYGGPWILEIWTKGPAGVLQRGRALLERLKAAGTTVVCQLTVTGLGPDWEPGVPWPVDWEGIGQMVDFVGPEAVCWRYDPVIPGVSTLENFAALAQQFQRLGVGLGNINWVFHERDFVRQRIGSLYERIDLDAEIVPFLTRAGEIGREYGIEVSVCAETRELAETCGLASRGCGHYPWFVQVSGRTPQSGFLSGPSRPGCKCTAYYDLGEYGQFARCHGCVYCYAR